MVGAAFFIAPADATCFFPDFRLAFQRTVIVLGSLTICALKAMPQMEMLAQYP